MDDLRVQGSRWKLRDKFGYMKCNLSISDTCAFYCYRKETIFSVAFCRQNKETGKGACILFNHFIQLYPFLIISFGWLVAKLSAGCWVAALKLRRFAYLLLLPGPLKWICLQNYHIPPEYSRLNKNSWRLNIAWRLHLNTFSGPAPEQKESQRVNKRGPAPKKFGAKKSLGL
jgi:hypothetical protein